MSELYLRSVVVNVYPASGSGRKIEGLRIGFRVIKTSESHPNTAELDIYNLSESSRAMFQATDSRVEILVGYKGIPKAGILGPVGDGSFQGNIESLFIGNVAKSVPKTEGGGNSKKPKQRYTQSVVEGVDKIMKVQLADGENRYRNARHTKGYPPNTSLNQVLDELTASLALARGSRTGVPEKKYANGLTLTGLARDSMNVLTKGNGLQWSIQDETLQILPKNGMTTDSIIVLTPKTGLIGSPQKTDKGLEFVSLLQPQLKPGRRVQIESQFVSGIFIVKKVTHEGDSHRGNFLSRCEASNTGGNA